MPEPRVRLVPLDTRHLAATLAWANDPELMRLLGRSSTVSPDEHLRWFEELRTRTDCRYFAIEATGDGRHLGNVWLWDIDARHRRAEVRVVMGAADGRDRGLGSDALDLAAHTAFETLGLARVYAYVFAFNVRARRAFEKAGFRVEGLLRQDRAGETERIDVYVLGRLATDAGPP